MLVSSRFVLLLAMAGVTYAVNCNRDGTSYSYTESVSGSQRTITTNHCPNHPFFNNNPNTAVSQTKTILIPAKPQLKGTANTADPLASAATYTKSLKAQGGSVGVFFSGAMLYSPFGAPDAAPDAVSAVRCPQRC